MPSNYILNNITDYITGEQKFANDKYSDPATLNFKFFIDFDVDSGLFANESNVNSALAYLNRIGETTRYNLLKVWISQFKQTIENYEYLFTEIEGLEIIQNAKPSQLFGSDEDQINIKIYEPIDFKIQTLIASYRHIVFDDKRGVEVLPTNLLRFSSKVFVFNHGYFNDILYGNSSNSDDIEQLIFPTKEKISLNKFNEMNHQVFYIEKCKFNIENSGKDFLGTVNNSMKSDGVINNLSFRFKFAHYDIKSSNIFGDFDINNLLAIESVQKNYENSLNAIELQNSVSNLNIGERGRFNRLKTFIKERRQIITESTTQFRDGSFGKQLIRSAESVGSNYIKTKFDFIQEGLDAVSAVNSFVTEFDPNLNLRKFASNVNVDINNLDKGKSLRVDESNVNSGDLQPSNINFANTKLTPNVDPNITLKNSNVNDEKFIGQTFDNRIRQKRLNLHRLDPNRNLDVNESNVNSGGNL